MGWDWEWFYQWITDLYQLMVVALTKCILLKVLEPDHFCVTPAVLSSFFLL
jgi:hypothetical protein